MTQSRPLPDGSTRPRHGDPACERRGTLVRSLVLLALLALPLTPAARAGEIADSLAQNRLDWIDSRYHAGTSFLILDDANQEAGIGLEISGPDPFRELSLQQASKVAPNWRLAVNFFDYQEVETSTPTKLTVFTLAAGWDYYMEGGGLEAETMRSPFLSAYLLGYFPDRTGKIPGRYDKNRLGVALGGGWQAERFKIRFEHAFLAEQGTGANNLSIGYQF